MGVKNLKIGKIKNAAYKVASLCTAVLIAATMSSCREADVKKSERHVKKDTYSTVTETSTKDTYNYSTTIEESSDNSFISFDEHELEVIEAKINANINDDFQSYLDGLHTKYKYSEYFKTTDALQEYKKMPQKDVKSTGVVTSKKVDKNSLLRMVLNNNEKFLSTYKGSNYFKISDDKLKEIVDIMALQLETVLKESDNIDVNILNSTLNSLEILEYKSFGNAYVSVEESKFCLNFTAIDALQKINSDVNMLERVVKHETNHLVQVGYSSDNSFKYNMGVSYAYSNLKVNTLYWDWFIEGSAEKMTLNRNNPNPFNYKNQVEAINTLAIANIVNVNGVNDIEEMTLQRDLNEFFHLFNAETDEEKEEIINMMFAYDIIFSENKDFINNYQEKNGYFDLSSLYAYQKELKPAIGQTLTKLFYSNLSDSLTKKELNLKQVFGLIRVFETEMCYLTDYDLDEKREMNREFISVYSDIQNEFFNNLAEESNLNGNELKNLYCKYSNFCAQNAQKGNVVRTDAEWLSSEKNEFLNQESRNKVLYISKHINSK